MGNSYSRIIVLCLVLVGPGGWALSLSPALAEVPGQSMVEKPVAPEGAKEEPPNSCGPLISDTCLPIGTHKASLQILWGTSIVGGNLTPSWRRVSAKEDFATYFTTVKFTYGLAEGLETYITVPYIHNVAGNVAPSLAGPGGERSANYGGVGDITAMAKYLLLPESDYRPALTGVFGVTLPSGHASHLNPGRLTTDAVGAGSFTFTTGFNLFKWLKPFMINGNVWLNTPVNVYPARDDTVRNREFVNFNVAVEYPLNKRWIALVEFYSTWTWTNISTPQGFQSPATLLGVLPGIEFFINEKWSLSAGAAIDLFGKSGTFNYTPLFSVYYNF